MNFELSEDQVEIKRTARELLAARSTWEKVREHATAGEDDAKLWAELSELGWPGIAVDEGSGGQGLGMVELCALLEELGYACAVTPFLGTVLAALAIAHAGSEEQKAAWLPKLASGEATGSLAIRDGIAPDADGADVIVVVDGDSATLVTGGADPAGAIDPTRRYGRVTAPAGEPLPGDVAAALARAQVAVSAELLGICQRALDMTVEYVKERKQFGVPVGSFQAVQHKAAQMLLDTESVRSVSYYAAWAADADPEHLAAAAAMAKASASQAARSVTSAAIQLHGGIGFTWEADVHWLFKRAQVLAPYLGGAGAQRARIAELAAADAAVGTV
jgi:alkylation response protein AidB-like acyl-CoA dehydrogenase